MGFGGALRAIVGNPLELPGLGNPLGNDGNALTFQFPLSFGTTVNDLANALHVPVGDILAVNPGLQPNSPLSLSQVIDLPPAHIDTIAHSLSNLGQTSSDLTPPRMDLTLPPNAPPQSYTTPLPGGSVNIVPPITATAKAAGDITGSVLRNVLPGTASPTQWTLDPPDVVSQVRAPTANAPIDSVSATASSPRTSTSVGDVSDPSMSRNDEGRIGFAHAAATVVRASQTHQHDSDGIPPPPLQPDASRASPLPGVQINPLSSFTPAYNAWSVVPVAADSNQAKLEIMALLAAQLSGSNVAGSTVAMPQAPAFIDPQIVAAQVASMRAGRVVDLGAGRSLEFTLVIDRMRRIDAIGREEQAATRRTGDGLNEKVQDMEAEEETQQSDDRRDDERRRQAAIAAMRRRRRPRSKRCRCRGGSSRKSGKVRYPKGVDLAEFRSRQPPRYLWTVSEEPQLPPENI